MLSWLVCTIPYITVQVRTTKQDIENPEEFIWVAALSSQCMCGVGKLNPLLHLNYAHVHALVFTSFP